MIDELDDMDDEGAMAEAHALPRRAPRTLSLDAAASTPAGKMAAMRAKAAPSLREFFSMRTPSGPIKIAFTHMPILHAVWRVWAAKRAEGADNPGASSAEIAEAMGVHSDSIRGILASLVRNEVVTATYRHVGYRAARALYSPTHSGTQALALMSVLPMGSFVHVGKTRTAWGSRSRTEPSNLFQHAALLRGGGDAPPHDPEYA